MDIAAKILVGLVALIHVYIFLLESVMFRARGVTAFKLSPQEVEQMATAMSNQGLYNLFLAVALGLGLFWPEPAVARAFVLFGLGCVIVAGIWGGITVMRTILFIQAAPAVLALVVYVLANHLIG